MARHKLLYKAKIRNPSNFHFSILIASFLIAAFDEIGESVDSANDNALPAGDAKNTDLPKPQKESKKTVVPTKKKRKSNVEKSLDVVFQKFQDASETDFLRYQG